VAVGIPEDEIAAAALEMKAGLIVLALRRGNGLFRSRQGTTTYRVCVDDARPGVAAGRESVTVPDHKTRLH
jgi:hypothetical protein